MMEILVGGLFLCVFLLALAVNDLNNRLSETQGVIKSQVALNQETIKSIKILNDCIRMLNERRI